MSLRAAALAAALVSLAAPVAQAAPARPSCRLVVDAAGDARLTAQPAGAFDVLSADIAADRDYVTTVVRVPQVPSGEPGSASVAYHFTWRYGGYRFHSTAATTSADRTFQVAAGPADQDVLLGLKTVIVGVFDAAKGEVRLSFQRSALRAAATGASGPFTEFSAWTEELPPVTVPWLATLTGLTGRSDTAEGRARGYLPGARSCVTPGR